jgi:hypothetical protein
MEILCASLRLPEEGKTYSVFLISFETIGISELPTKEAKC